MSITERVLTINAEAGRVIGDGNTIMNIDKTLSLLQSEFSKDSLYSFEVKKAFRKPEGNNEYSTYSVDLAVLKDNHVMMVISQATREEDVEKHLFVPEKYFQGSVEDFWRQLPELDVDFETRRKELEAKGLHWRFVARMEEGKTSVSLETVDAAHPFYQLEGSNNIILITTERYHDYPMMIRGYGAGAGVTAAGVFANIMSVSH